MHHSGAVPGFSTLVAFSPSSNVGLVVLSNADEKADWNYMIARRILDDVVGTQTSVLDLLVLDEIATPAVRLLGFPGWKHRYLVMFRGDRMIETFLLT